jgi:hypothetical protein
MTGFLPQLASGPHDRAAARSPLGIAQMGASIRPANAVSPSTVIWPRAIAAKRGNRSKHIAV